ncbi:hypothetical protein LOZ66_000536 [Ophidiomyces ophidiicola]|nr:hypothetical protein LOZ66_000536 [Ophidiomyces ophidiicola]
MAHVRDCPEFHLDRSDSKNPLTTCQGVTSDGRKCRRSIVSAKDAAKKAAIAKQLGNRTAGKAEVPAEDFFCWQHKDQAYFLKKKGAPTTQVRGRSSIDSLAEKVGLLNMGDGKTSNTKGSKPQHPAPPSRPERRVRDGTQAQQRSSRPSNETPAVSTPRPKKRLSAGRRLFCFITGIDDGNGTVLNVRRRTEQARPTPQLEPQVARMPPRFQPQHAKWPTTAQAHRPHSEIPQIIEPAEYRAQKQNQRQSMPADTSSRPSMLGQHSSSSSQTQSLLSWIPTSLSPETTSKLLQKLSEPLSSSEEAGYIYIYCVTPNSTAPLPDIAPFLVPHRTEIGPPTTEIMQSAGISLNRVRNDNLARVASTITLKIGRAVNVSRRLTQQCAQNLTLVRYYPYSPPSSNVPPQKAPNVHRLERLIHIELGDRRFRLQDPCKQCGKRHQEFFEIEADREQLKMVDECVRRWVRFSQLDPSRFSVLRTENAVSGSIYLLPFNLEIAMSAPTSEEDLRSATWIVGEHGKSTALKVFGSWKGEDGLEYLAISKMPGTMLSEAWMAMEKSEKESVLQNLQTILNQFWELHVPLLILLEDNLDN